MLAVPTTKGVYHEGTQRQAQSLAKDLPAEAWERVSAGTGSKGERLYDWTCMALPEPGASADEELIRVVGSRWAIEDCFEQAKGEVGLDEYELRKWDGWYRYVTLSLLAHAYLAVLRSNAANGDEIGGKKGMAAPI